MHSINYLVQMFIVIAPKDVSLDISFQSRFYYGKDRFVSPVGSRSFVDSFR